MMMMVHNYKAPVSKMESVHGGAAGWARLAITHPKFW